MLQIVQCAVEAVEIAIKTVFEYENKNKYIEKVIFACFDMKTKKEFKKALQLLEEK